MIDSTFPDVRPGAGDVYLDSSSLCMHLFDGEQWINLGYQKNDPEAFKRAYALAFRPVN